MGSGVVPASAGRDHQLATSCAESHRPARSTPRPRGQGAEGAGDEFLAEWRQGAPFFHDLSSRPGPGEDAVGIDEHGAAGPGIGHDRRIVSGGLRAERFDDRREVGDENRGMWAFSRSSNSCRRDAEKPPTSSPAPASTTPTSTHNRRPQRRHLPDDGCRLGLPVARDGHDVTRGPVQQRQLHRDSMPGKSRVRHCRGHLLAEGHIGDRRSAPTAPAP